MKEHTLVRITGDSLDEHIRIAESDDVYELDSLIRKDGFTFDYECESGWWYINDNVSAVIAHKWLIKELNANV